MQSHLSFPAVLTLGSVVALDTLLAVGILQCSPSPIHAVTTAVFGAHFGQGTGPINLDDIKCRGDETNILSCPQLPMNVPHNCRHSEDAGVQCKGKGNWQ